MSRLPESVRFVEPSLVDASLSESIRSLRGSEILKIAAEIREMNAAGAAVFDYTVGDFAPRHFPIPAALRDHVIAAYGAGETNYPPSDGVLALREAVAALVARTCGVRYPLSSVLIASGARPILYAAYRTVLDPGDPVIYPVPSWNNNHYTRVCGAVDVVVPTHPEDGFMPTVEALEPHLERARMLCLNSPLNPTGTVIRRGQLESIMRRVVEENERRARRGGKHLFVLHDQVYSALVFGDARHHHPVELVPESAPWVIGLDGISKSLAATGLRVGWSLAAPEVTARMRNLIGHIGAWAPRPEQVALARLLADRDALARFQAEMNERVRGRLDALYRGFDALREAGYPVRCIAPEGAIYLSLQLDLVGRRIGGVRLASNEDVRRVVLERSGVAVIPFQAFGLEEESGWFRLAVGAVTLEQIEETFPRMRRLLDEME